VSETNAFAPVAPSTSDWCRCQPQGKKFRERRPAYERRQEPTPLADRLHRAAEEDHRVRRGEALHRPVRELDLAGTPLVLDRARRQTDVPEPVADRLERVADAVEPRVGEELVATLEDLDLGRRTGLALACLVQPDPGTREARDVELDLKTCQIPVAHLAEARKLGAQLRATVERQRPPAHEVDVADHPTRPVGPRQHPERGRIGHDHDVRVARELVDPETAALREQWWEHAVAGIEAEDRAGEVGAASHRRDRTLAREMLAPRDAVLVDEDQAHRPQPELLDARDDLDRCLRLLIRVQPVPLDEPRRSQTQTLAHVTNSSDRSCLSRPWRSYGTSARTKPRENTRSI
jgi:hypothetical protein